MAVPAFIQNLNEPSPAAALPSVGRPFDPPLHLTPGDGDDPKYQTTTPPLCFVSCIHPPSTVGCAAACRFLGQDCLILGRARRLEIWRIVGGDRAGSQMVLERAGWVFGEIRNIIPFPSPADEPAERVLVTTDRGALILSYSPASADEDGAPDGGSVGWDNFEADLFSIPIGVSYLKTGDWTMVPSTHHLTVDPSGRYCWGELWESIGVLFPSGVVRPARAGGDASQSVLSYPSQDLLEAAKGRHQVHASIARVKEEQKGKQKTHELKKKIKAERVKEERRRKEEEQRLAETLDLPQAGRRKSQRIKAIQAKEMIRAQYNVDKKPRKETAKVKGFHECMREQTGIFNETGWGKPIGGILSSQKPKPTEPQVDKGKAPAEEIFVEKRKPTEERIEHSSPSTPPPPQERSPAEYIEPPTRARDAVFLRTLEGSVNSEFLYPSTPASPRMASIVKRGKSRWLLLRSVSYVPGKDGSGAGSLSDIDLAKAHMKKRVKVPNDSRFIVPLELAPYGCFVISDAEMRWYNCGDMEECVRVPFREATEVTSWARISPIAFAVSDTYGDVKLIQVDISDLIVSWSVCPVGNISGKLVAVDGYTLFAANPTGKSSLIRIDEDSLSITVLQELDSLAPVLDLDLASLSAHSSNNSSDFLTGQAGLVVGHGTWSDGDVSVIRRGVAWRETSRTAQIRAHQTWGDGDHVVANMGKKSYHLRYKTGEAVQVTQVTEPVVYISRYGDERTTVRSNTVVVENSSTGVVHKWESKETIYGGSQSGDQLLIWTATQLCRFELPTLNPVLHTDTGKKITSASICGDYQAVGFWDCSLTFGNLEGADTRILKDVPRNVCLLAPDADPEDSPMVLLVGLDGGVLMQMTSSVKETKVGYGAPRFSVHPNGRAVLVTSSSSVGILKGDPLSYSVIWQNEDAFVADCSFYSGGIAMATSEGLLTGVIGSEPSTVASSMKISETVRRLAWDAPVEGKYGVKDGFIALGTIKRGVVDSRETLSGALILAEGHPGKIGKKLDEMPLRQYEVVQNIQWTRIPDNDGQTALYCVVTTAAAKTTPEDQTVGRMLILGVSSEKKWYAVCHVNGAGGIRGVAVFGENNDFITMSLPSSTVVFHLGAFNSEQHPDLPLRSRQPLLHHIATRHVKMPTLSIAADPEEPMRYTVMDIVGSLAVLDLKRPDAGTFMNSGEDEFLLVEHFEHRRLSRPACMSPFGDGRVLVCDMDGTVRVFGTREGKPIAEIRVDRVNQARHIARKPPSMYRFKDGPVRPEEQDEDEKQRKMAVPGVVLGCVTGSIYIIGTVNPEAESVVRAVNRVLVDLLRDWPEELRVPIPACSRVEGGDVEYDDVPELTHSTMIDHELETPTTTVLAQLLRGSEASEFDRGYAVPRYVFRAYAGVMYRIRTRLARPFLLAGRMADFRVFSAPNPPSIERQYAEGYIPRSGGNPLKRIVTQGDVTGQNPPGPADRALIPVDEAAVEELYRYDPVPAVNFVDNQILGRYLALGENMREMVTELVKLVLWEGLKREALADPGKGRVWLERARREEDAEMQKIFNLTRETVDGVIEGLVRLT